MPAASSKSSLYPGPRGLSKQIQDAITAFGDNPTAENREVLEQCILRYGYRRKYDGEFLTPKRPSRNSRSRK